MGAALGTASCSGLISVRAPSTSSLSNALPKENVTAFEHPNDTTRRVACHHPGLATTEPVHLLSHKSGKLSLYESSTVSDSIMDVRILTSFVAFFGVVLALDNLGIFYQLGA